MMMTTKRLWVLFVAGEGDGADRQTDSWLIFDSFDFIYLPDLPHPSDVIHVIHFFLFSPFAFRFSTMLNVGQCDDTTLIYLSRNEQPSRRAHSRLLDNESISAINTISQEKCSTK